MTKEAQIFLLADSRLLFSSRGEDSPFAAALGGSTPSAAYVGASNGDEPAYYDIFEAAMDGIGVSTRHMVMSAYRDRDREALERATLIVLAGGDAARGWSVLQATGMHDVVAERHRAGATLVGISAGAVLLGTHAWNTDDLTTAEPFVALGLVPFVVDAHDEAHDWLRLRMLLARGELPNHAIALPAGSGAIYHADGTLEALRRPLSELTLSSTGIIETLIVPPEIDQRYTRAQ